MIGAVCFKVTNEYEVRIYMVGTYEQMTGQIRHHAFWEKTILAML